MSFLYDPHINEFCELPHNQKCKITDKQNLNKYDTYILQVVSYYCKRHSIIGNFEIEYEMMNNVDNFEIDQINDKHPLLTLIAFPDLQSHSVIQSEVDEESYKYKDIQDKNKLSIYIPNNSTFVSINGSNYYTVFSQNQKCYYLKINIWESSKENSLLTDIEHIENEPESTIEVEKNIDRNEVFEDIIYNTTECTTLIQSLIDNSEITTNTIINIQFIVGHNYDVNKLENEYGDITFDLLDIIKGDLKETNRFYNNKFVQKMYSLDVCYWIINECIKSNLWKLSEYNNYDYIINAENISHIFNFIIFSSRIWMNYFKSLYNIPDNMKINISEIFVAKNIQKSHYGYSTEGEKQHFECIIRLNDIVDTNGGSIIVNENMFTLQQGDMFIYNYLHKRQDEIIVSGEVFYVVFIVHLVI